VNVGLIAKAGAVVMLVGFAVAFVDRERRRAAAEERYSILAEKYAADSAAHAQYVANAHTRDSAAVVRALELTAQLDEAKAGWRVAARVAVEADQRAEEAWEEAREELDPADYNEIREAYDRLDDAHDECSLALKDCGTLSAQLQADADSLRADIEERDRFEDTSEGTIQSLRLELADANKVDWLPWGIAAGASALLLAFIIAG
jgi:hypothetical protein